MEAKASGSAVRQFIHSRYQSSEFSRCGGWLFSPYPKHQIEKHPRYLPTYLFGTSLRICPGPRIKYKPLCLERSCQYNVC